MNNNRLTFHFDSNADGNPNQITTYTFDANNNQLTSHFDINADGNANQITTYTYDVNNNLLTQNFDTNADGNPNIISTYTYDASNNLLTLHYDTNADGNPNQITTNTYDVNNNLLTQNVDTNADGNSNQIQTYTYDVNNNQLTSLNDTDADGNPNQITTYTYGSCAPLPIELNSLIAKTDNNFVIISWQTASEENNAGFKIERSKNASDWEVLGFVRGLGASNYLQKYDWIDNTPLEGINYYRLRQIDFNNAFEYSKVISAYVDSDEEKIMLYPSVANQHLNLVTTLDNRYQVSIYNLTGEQLMNWSSNESEQMRMISLF